MQTGKEYVIVVLLCYCNFFDVEKYLDFIKKIKEGSKPHWKQTEKEIEAIYGTVGGIGEIDIHPW